MPVIILEVSNAVTVNGAGSGSGIVKAIPVPDATRRSHSHGIRPSYLYLSLFDQNVSLKSHGWLFYFAAGSF